MISWQFAARRAGGCGCSGASRTTPAEPASHGERDHLELSTAAPGAQGFPGFTPETAVDDGRDNVALFIGAESQLTRQTPVKRKKPETRSTRRKSDFFRR
jgi:hypothetical protein